jgi:hypothetical protein
MTTATIQTTGTQETATEEQARVAEAWKMFGNKGGLFYLKGTDDDGKAPVCIRYARQTNVLAKRLPSGAARIVYRQDDDPMLTIRRIVLERTLTGMGISVSRECYPDEKGIIEALRKYAASISDFANHFESEKATGGRK